MGRTTSLDEQAFWSTTGDPYGHDVEVRWHVNSVNIMVKSVSITTKSVSIKVEVRYYIIKSA